jgi:uncharacterized protein (TIGR02466 family)
MNTASADLFAVPLHSARFKGFEQQAPALLSDIALVAGQPSPVHASNQHAWHSDREFHLRNGMAYSWLRSSILAFARAAMPKGPPFRITECWAISTPFGGFMTPHTHFPSPLSGVLYLAAERATTPDVADRAGKLELFNPVTMPEMFGAPTSVVIAPIDGVALLFPGCLSHMVHPNRTDEARVSISFNLGFAA